LALVCTLPSDCGDDSIVSPIVESAVNPLPITVTDSPAVTFAVPATMPQPCVGGYGSAPALLALYKPTTISVAAPSVTTARRAAHWRHAIPKMLMCALPRKIALPPTAVILAQISHVGDTGRAYGTPTGLV